MMIFLDWMQHSLYTLPGLAHRAGGKQRHRARFCATDLGLFAATPP
jgi:hypothetical protein